MSRHGLGDLVERALSSVGITEERLSGWLGRPCGCRKRRDKLNKLGEWARRTLGGTSSQEATTELANLAGDPTIVPPTPQQVQPTEGNVDT